jgi:hypothetical protein
MDQVRQLRNPSVTAQTFTDFLRVSKDKGKLFLEDSPTYGIAGGIYGQSASVFIGRPGSRKATFNQLGKVEMDRPVPSPADQGGPLAHSGRGQERPSDIQQYMTN